MKSSWLVGKLFALDRGVRYVAVFSANGRKIAGGMRKGVQSLEPSSRAKQVDRKTVQYVSYLVSLREYLGNTRCVILRFEKTDVVVVPFSRRVVMIGTEVGILSRILDRISVMLDEVNKGKREKSD